MFKYYHRFLAITIVLTLGPAVATFAQTSATLLRAKLVSPSWLVTVEGEARARTLKILDLAERSEGKFLLDATYGWIDGSQDPVRAEIEQAGTERRLRITTPPGSVIVATQSPDGSFAGTFTPKNGTAKAVRLEKLTEQDLQIKIKSTLAAREAQVFADEDKDWGIEPTSTPRQSQYHAPTPRSIPDARVIKTMELKALLDANKTVVVIDVLDSTERTTVPGAFWMSGAGAGQFYAAEERRFAAALAKLTDGDVNRPIVFLCLGSECWLSYNASLHALNAGYKNVMWYRGGTDSWGRARLARAKPIPMNW
jgi:PQQ-dependent catabolism-associated CXXCW motif protein